MDPRARGVETVLPPTPEETPPEIRSRHAHGAAPRAENEGAHSKLRPLPPRKPDLLRPSAPTQPAPPTHPWHHAAKPAQADANTPATCSTGPLAEARHLRQRQAARSKARRKRQASEAGRVEWRDKSAALRWPPSPIEAAIRTRAPGLSVAAPSVIARQSRRRRRSVFPMPRARG